MRIVDYSPSAIYPDIVDWEASHYEKGLQTFISKCAEGLSADAAFYEFGRLRTPGVSDIDLLIIVRDDEWQKAREIAQSLMQSSVLFRYIFTHEPVIVTQSMIPHLFLLHTLENCRQVHGKRDPLSEADSLSLDAKGNFIRHAVWASFMRIAALELQHSCIGLRRTLILMHNLLTSALYGISFLSNQPTIDLDTNEIRNEILTTSLENQEEIARSYLKKIIDILNQIDTSIDEDCNHKAEFDSGALFDIPIAPDRSLVPLSLPASDMIGRVSSFAREKVMLIPVPAYQVAVAAKLAVDINEEVSGLEVLAKYRTIRAMSISGRFPAGSKEYIEHLSEVVRKCSDQGVRYFFPSPFLLGLKRRRRWGGLRQVWNRLL